MLVNQSEFSCVLGMKNIEKHWHVYINIQKYVLPVYLGTTCVRKRVALLKAQHSCRNRCLGLWDRRQLPPLLHFLLWLLQDSISIFSAALQSEPCHLWDLRRYKVKKRLLLLWLTIQKSCYSAAAQVNKTAWWDEGCSFKIYVPSTVFLNNFNMLSEAAEGLGNSWSCICGHQKFTLTYTP